MTKTMISARIPEKLSDDLETLAALTNRSKGYLLTAALEDYVGRQAWLAKKIDAAVKAADEADMAHSNESVIAWIESWGTENPLPRPQPDIHLNRSK